MVFRFSQALVIAVILTGLALLNKKLGPSEIFVLMLYLLLAAVFPWLMVPIGVIAILWQLYSGGATKIAGFFQNFAPSKAPDSGKIGAGSH